MERKVSSASSDSGVGGEVEPDLEVGPEETDKRIITPDDVAVRQLLNFDEEEEDTYSDYSDDEGPSLCNPSVQHKKWRQAVMKDITSLGSGRCLTRSDSLDGARSETGGEEGRLSLAEVGHIRQVLARAELEAASEVSPGLKAEVEGGGLCGVCRLTRFSRLVAPVRCAMCRQLTCRACVDMTGRVESQTTVRIADIPPALLQPLQQAAPAPHTRDNCAGSAPNSPRPSRQVGGEEPPSPPAPPLLPPPVTSRSSLGRLSLVIWPLQQPSDNKTIICLLCKNIVKQILRTKGYNNRVAVKR